ncbi:MAG TPA: polysaccharide ABC transporter ATP-binding protein [Cytophagaceae bacterium]|nr:polysaccharide ABC transporter ATP-binding protein [Cytophagaceae bacterium]
MNPILEVRNIGKKFNILHNKQPYLSLRDSLAGLWRSSGQTQEEFWALKDISFDIYPGESIGIIGRNGAGKSTLLKILSKITPPSTGHIKCRGRIASLLEVGTGFHPELTGRENIYLNGSILGLKRVEIDKQFDAIVDFSGTEKFLDTPLKHYSSGMQLRLAFAVAAHLEPEILIIDEVLAVGDSEFQKKCMGKMDEVSKSGRTVLFVSHNMGTILQLCKKSILLNRGQVEEINLSPQVVEKYYKFVSDTGSVAVKKDADIYFKEVYTCNEKGEPSANFAHKENIYLRLKIGVNHYDPIQNIGLAMLTRDKKRVFTVNKALENFYKEGMTEVTVDFIIKGGLIAPMDYSFLVALNSKSGIVNYDQLDDISTFKIYDDGTEFAFAEGYDYGCIILKDEWRKVN